MNTALQFIKQIPWAESLSSLLIATLLAGCGPSATAQADASDTAEIWMADFDAALEKAADENKYTLVNISGLSWCGWCKALEREVFSQPEFINYVEDNLVAVLLDFDRSGKAVNEDFASQHEALLRRFGVQGFPTVLILNPAGKVIERDGYQRGGAKNYVDFIKTVIANDPM